MSEQHPQGSSRDSGVRHAYETEGLYSVSTICRKFHQEATEYVDELLADKMNSVRCHLQPGLLVDLCCATGGHLLDLAGAADEGMGIDFSEPYIARATADAVAQSAGHMRFIVGDAQALSLKDGSVGTLFSFSALYAIPDVGKVIAEIARVLRPGGRAILDFGNSRSLNTFCVRHYYADWPRTYPIPVKEMLSLLGGSGLQVLEHRAFQVLPLWAGGPAWLWPLLHPGWKRVMKKRFRGRMTDEWVSSLWPFRQFAFRHLIVVRKG